MNQSDINALSAPLTQENADMADPRQHFAWALRYFPNPNTQIGDVPIHPVVRGPMSQILWDLGYRHQPELQTKFFIPGDHPEAGDYLNLPSLVDRKTYEEYLAAHADPVAQAQKLRKTAEAVLAKVDPQLLQRINEMTPEERAKAAEVQREQLPPALQRLGDLAAAIEQDSSTSEKTE